MKKLLLVAVAVGALMLASVALAAAPTGSYRAKIHSSALSGALNGTWTITLTRGHYGVAFNGKTVLKGKDSIHGSTITVGGGGANAYCHSTGTYRFHLRGRSLSFTEIKDSSQGCGGRRLVLTTGHFTKV